MKKRIVAYCLVLEVTLFVQHLVGGRVARIRTAINLPVLTCSCKLILIPENHEDDL